MRFFALCCVLLWHSAAFAEWFDDEQAIMGTDIRVTLWHSDKNVAQQAIADVMAEMHRIDQTLSPYIETSDLAQVNANAAQKPIPLTDELSTLVDKSLYYSQVSQGAFDITFASVGWRYDYRQGKQPTAAETQQLLPAINYRLLQLDKPKQTLKFDHPNVRIDLGGIAKGYAVDQAIRLLASRGIQHATVSAGGDSRLLGDRLGRPWLIGIKNPRISARDEREVVLTLPLSDVAVSTSGDYERYFIDQKTGERVHHIINPRTGRSAGELMSVTILGPEAVDTDALSTTVFVLGVEKGLAMIERLEGFDAVVIDRQGRVHYSEGLAPPTTESNSSL